MSEEERKAAEGAADGAAEGTAEGAPASKRGES